MDPKRTTAVFGDSEGCAGMGAREFDGPAVGTAVRCLLFGVRAGSGLRPPPLPARGAGMLGAREDVRGA